MNIKYDTVADAIYVAMTQAKVAKTLKVSENLMLDVDAEGNTVGLEILEASSQEELVENIRRNAAHGIPVSIESSTPVIA